MALASFSALLAPSISFRFSSSSKLMSKVAPLVPPYWKERVPDTVLTSRLLVTSKSLPVTEDISPRPPPRPETV